MSNVRSKNLKGIAFEVQYVISDKIYRKLYEIMCSLLIADIVINFKEVGKISIMESITEKGMVYFYLDANSIYNKEIYGYSGFSDGEKRGIGQINFNKPLSTIELECPVFIIIQRIKSISPENKADKYHKWLGCVKAKMQELIKEQKKFENILEDISQIPTNNSLACNTLKSFRTRMIYMRLGN